ncbi:hypothetical protein PVT68_03560 [Microbulbifer bruguierae]|uniref:Secreted protein n=1 Tax=Microbulbifer bruguierae TaxID=3029061 RepID=A0ABY8NFB9_9GAMM|nr:hypothetical protein [Microbulbifer bruguierae]WGL17380.1 hypothetical protein PVT68_03560 [Microbulbifer bruguierae]
MAVNRGCSLIFAGVLGVIGWCAVVQAASTLSAEQNRLARMEQLLENYLVELEDVENEMLAYDYKLKRAEESLQKARENHKSSLMALKVAEREHKGAPTSDTERALHKAEHAFAMAERGVESRNRRVEIIQSTHTELEARLQKSRTSVADGKSRLAKQQVVVDNLIQAMLNKVDEQPTQMASAPKPEVPAAADVVANLDVPEPTLASLSPQLPDDSAPIAATAEAVPVADQREVDPELLEYVRGERQRLEKVLGELDEDDEGKQTFRSLSLRPSGEGAIEFEFLGQDQYKLVAPVSAGRQTYKINSWRFRRTIPADDDGVRYVFIFDARRLSRPRLVMYPEYVLSQLD